jgi:SSS family solute:Na+ symporter
MKPLASLTLGGDSYTFFVGLGALILNIVVAVVATVIVRMVLPERTDATARS